MAEIPAFQERQAMDTDEDGERQRRRRAMPGRRPPAPALAKDLHLGVGAPSSRRRPTPTRSSFPPGAGGLSTLRLECGYAAPLANRSRARRALDVQDGSWPSGSAGARSSRRRTARSSTPTACPQRARARSSPAYPADMIAQPLDIRSASIAVRSGSRRRLRPRLPAAIARRPACGARAAGNPGERGPTGVAAPAVVPAASPPSSRRSSSRPTSPRSSCWPRSPRRRARRVARPDARARQDADGGVPRRLARDVAATRSASGLCVATSHTLGIIALALVIVGGPGRAAAGRRGTRHAGRRRGVDRRHRRLDAPTRSVAGGERATPRLPTVSRRP